MSVFIASVLGLFRILVRPIFAPSVEPDFNFTGQKVVFLLFLHMMVGLFVLLLWYGAGQAYSDDANVGNWTIVIVFVTIGVISIFSLIIRGCQNKLRAQSIRITKMSDPSANLRILFLWIFTLAVAIHVLADLAIDIQCTSLFSLRNTRVVFTFLSNFALLLFLFMQTGFITYYKKSTFLQGSLVNVASIVILAANFTVWFNAMLSSIYVFDRFANSTVPKYSNESYCFRTSSIQTELVSKVRPFLLPPRLEFCILASSFIISFWRWPFECQQENNSRNMEDDEQMTSREKKYQISGSHIVATVIGIVVNVPILITQLLLAFVFNWNNQDGFFAMHFGQCISSLCCIIAIYICSYHLNRQFNSCWRPEGLSTNEYILIISSSTTMAYFMFGFLAALTNPVPVYLFILSRITAMLELFLQTHFLIKLKRYITEDEKSVLISCIGIFLMVKNLIFWFVYSYNAYLHYPKSPNLNRDFVDTRIDQNWPDMRKFLVPVKSFYRFFSAMISYSVYYKFRPIQ